MILQSLKERAQLVYERFNAVKGVTCNELEGALYAFPKVEIPEAAWADCRVSSSCLVCPLNIVSMGSTGNAQQH